MTTEVKEGLDQIFVRFDPLTDEVKGCHIKRITLHIVNGVIRFTDEADVEAVDVEKIAEIVGPEAAAVLMRCNALEIENAQLRAALEEADAKLEAKQAEARGSSETAAEATQQLARIQQEILDNFAPAASALKSMQDLGSPEEWARRMEAMEAEQANEATVGAPGGDANG